ncbi:MULTISPECIES: hypothetical protein [unclassified Breznakia]|uniref:hypothetical protein n=1 Tax=unclassified Breznakia TaxID=2623764 RepID=UPI002476700A|nr:MULTISPECIES: hypothetical protein [unclassified Breznakia]MDH6367053.1 hypothetical protein [Breznakia sp. PH1-1]MDH6404175.1 hypothetical protein [Breznakia sp. PF1-11]MDH6411940.1 hypothetical protein [Breznakia sp. PFB1-11]MDH6414163.1 hypothetical protein [Breznakia sp. PFB1-14]MDH6418916.1 hypothetical protein [Breznakia sp. PFB1-12]
MGKFEETKVVKKYEVRLLVNDHARERRFDNKESAMEFFEKQDHDGKVYEHYYSKYGKGEAFDIKVVAHRVNGELVKKL